MGISIVGPADGHVNYSTPVTGFALTLADDDWHVILNPAGTLAAGTITMGPFPFDGQVVNIRSTQIITALTFAPNTGQSVVSAPTTIAVRGEIEAVYRLATTSWYFSSNAAAGGGGGVNAGTINQIAYYAAAGSTVSGETLLQAVNMPALTGDVITPGGSLAATIANGAVSNGKMASMPTLTIKGNATGSTAAPTDIASGGGTTNFLRADLTWAAPAGGGTPGGSTLQVQYNNAGAFGGVNLFVESANVLGQRNGVNAQSKYVYNTFTDASNYERGVFDWTTTANVLSIGTQAAGTGTVRNLKFVVGGVNQLDFGITNAAIWTTSAGINCGSLNTAGGINAGGNNIVTGGSAFLGIVSSGFLQGAAANVLRFCDAGLGINGWLNWAGQTRVTADFSVTSSVALVNVTGLSVAVAAGRTYSFDVYLSCTCAAAGGVKAAIAGTATATNIIYDGWMFDTNVMKGQANSAALGGTVASSTTTATAGVVIQIKGTITVNAAGTLTVQIAQNTSSATATIAKRGSYFIVHDMP